MELAGANIFPNFQNAECKLKVSLGCHVSNKEAFSPVRSNKCIQCPVAVIYINHHKRALLQDKPNEPLYFLQNKNPDPAIHVRSVLTKKHPGGKPSPRPAR